MFARKSVLVVAAVILAEAATAFAADAPGTGAPKVRIGTYDTRAVALAYLRSEDWQKEIAKLRTEVEKAKAAGDEKRVGELQPQGERGQRRAHAQVFSNGPIDDILPKLKDAMAAVAKKANVAVIVPSAAWHDDSVELVDVTELLAEQFKPSDETRKIMAEIRKSQPMDFVEAVMMKDW